ncbi:Putative membrane protein [Kitasatospora sp. MMS16-BH015]|uniref:hypothetical protein n=1 Tax=Kitasatospora sp. MMS16-BH015 TaxID=2018025 RepID=UPI000CA0CFC5|nr:hypothetical protein [Kitasatospora sp. MMS16-BH015]AUG76580.1 Putative membrane protein [Kitasatospora sp. MMS16-BH015]
MAYPVGRLARRRALGLCIALLVLGSPWVQRPFFTADRTPATGWLLQVLEVPAWQPSLALRYAVPGLVDWSADLSAAVLLLGCYLLLPRLVPAAPAGPVRWMTAIGTGAAITALAVLPLWAIRSGLQDLHVPAVQVLTNLLGPSIAFGLLLGLVAGFLYLPTGGAAPQAVPPRLPRLRRPGRTLAMAEPATPALGSVPGDATRYLCAAAYQDPGFARLVVEEVLADEFGAVAPSPGVDLVPVARHCLAARELLRRRDRTLLPVYLGLLLVSPFWLLIGRLVLRLLALGAVPPRAKHPVRGHADPDSSATLGRLAATGLSALVLALGLGVLLGQLPFDGVWVWLFGTYLYGIPPLLALATAAVLTFRTVRAHLAEVDKRLRETLRRERFDPAAVPQPAPEAPWAKDRLGAIAEAQRGNVTVYSGYTPFLGFAKAQGTLTVNVPLLPAEKPGQPAGEVTEFEVWELITELRAKLEALAVPETAEDGLHGLILEDRVFVDGATLHGDTRFFDDSQLAPVTRLTPEQLREVAEHPSGTVRHYLAAHLPMWGDDVVPSLFLHLSTTGRTLDIRCSIHALGPVHRSYHAVDSLPLRLTGEHRHALLLGALRDTGPALGGALRAALDRRAAERRRLKRLVRDHAALGADPAFDHGARLSVREAALGPVYQNFFQELDAYRTVATLAQHAMAAIRVFLDEHGVDTTALRGQQLTILNHGVLQQGGVSIVGNQAVGTNSQAVNDSSTRVSMTKP